MALRCKEGDLAVMLNGQYVGYIVRVGEFIGSIGNVYSLSRKELVRRDNAWRVYGLADYPCNFVEEDRYMQPIRPPKVAKTTETKQEIEA